MHTRLCHLRRRVQRHEELAERRVVAPRQLVQLRLPTPASPSLRLDESTRTGSAG
jgi:hypothetical protein